MKYGQTYYQRNRKTLLEKKREYGKQNPEKLKERRESTKNRYSALKSRCKRLKKFLSISFEEYAEIVKNDCFYCGGILPPAGFGLDRIDSSLGYTINNVLPCCRVCNVLKNDKSVLELLEHLPKFLAGLKRLPNDIS